MSQGDKSAKEARPAGPELRLIDRRAFVGFPELTVAQGLVITDFALQIPDVTFPFNVTGGASRYQKKKLDFGFLELFVDRELVARRVSELAGKLDAIDDLKLHFRPGYLEGQGRLKGGDRAAVTFKVAFDGDGEKLAVYVYDVRLYAFSATPACQLAPVMAKAVEALSILPGIELRGASGFTSRLLPPLVQLAAVSRGFKMPSLESARLGAAEVSSKGLKLRFAANGLPPPSHPDEELLLALEGARAFADAEELVARGKLAEAREAYLRLGDAREAHPFAAERLLALLVADPQAHEMALDVAQSLQRRREKSATALWAEAVVRERRGEPARAAERWLALCALSRKNQEEAAAFFAAESAARAARDNAPQMAVRALHEVLGLKPDHLPSLKALARASDQAQDRAGAIRAYRRIAALARDPAEAAEAHVHLARLCALTEDDVAGARLHCEAALRLAPDHPDALYQLAELCFRGNEHLRAIKALDRLREVAMGRHEVDRIGRANLLAGQIWELGLEQPENALLRYREAVSLLPGEAEPLYFAARVADRLGKVQEAVSGYQQAIEIAGPAPRGESVRKAAHACHHAMARLYKTRLADPARAREHLEAALALEPTDMVAIEELLPYFRASGRVAELADACEKAAAVTADPTRRAAFWAEAGELYRTRLGKPDKAGRLLDSALEADPHNRMALEGMLALAESRRDGERLCRCLKALAQLAEDARERVRLLRRLAVAARDLSFDLDLAAWAFAQVLEAEPNDLPALGELCALERRRGDMGGLARALEWRASAAENAGDKRLAAAALRELAGVLESRLGRVGEALAALEKAARLSPDHQVLLDLANLSMRCDRPEHARRALEDVLLSMPKHSAPDRVAEVRARLGRACELLGDREAALEHYAAAFPTRRLDDELAQRLEALYEETGRIRELTDFWAARGQALLQAGRPAEASPLFFKSARALLEQNDRAGAILKLSAALEAAPSGPQAAQILEAMADLELERGEKLEAAKLYARRAGLLDAPREAARTLFKAAQLALGTPREAVFLEQALEKDPSFAPARIRRAELAAASEPREALADLEAVLHLENDPDAPSEADRLELMRKAGWAALGAGLFDTARKHLALYTAKRPADLEAQRQLAALHRRAGAKEALCDLLGELWPSLVGQEQISARREYAELCLELSRSTEAAAALRSMLAANPTDAWAAKRLLTLLPSEGADASQRSERLELLSVLVESTRGDERAGLLATRAGLLREQGRLDEAKADLREAANVSSRPGPLLRALADACAAAGDEVGELSAWAAAAEREPSEAKEAAPRILELARRRLAANDVDRAREGFELAAALPLSAQDSCEAWFGVADAAQARSDAHLAADALEKAARQGPAKRRAEALIRRAGLLEGLGELEAAGESYEEALKLAPRNPQATAGLKRVLERQSDWAALAEVLTGEAAALPKEKAAFVYQELGFLYLEKLSQKVQAEAAFRRAAQLDKSNVTARRALAHLLSEKGELREAARLLEEAAGALGPEKAASLLREGAGLARMHGDGELALKLSRKAHALVPATGEALFELAELLYLHGAVGEALPVQRQLAQEVSFDDAPDIAEAVYLRLADLAEQQGNRALAESTLRKVVRERPLCTAAVERLATLLHADRPREALELWAAHARQLSASERTAQLLADLGERAVSELADVDLAAQLFERAAEMASEPLPLHRRLARLYRDAGRTQELGEALNAIATAELERGNLEGALEVYAEAAHLAEASGRIDEALVTLERAVELCQEQEQPELAATYERRRAEMLRDARLDLDGAEVALRRAYELHPELATAQAGMALARRRGDHDAEIDWLERVIDLTADSAERAKWFVELATLHIGGHEADLARAVAPDQAEAALREALTLDPSRQDAHSLLVSLLEQQGRAHDVAALYEEAALRAPPERRAALLLQAARTYKDRAQNPHAAAAALLAARAAAPDDAALTAEAAEMLHEIGRTSDAAELDGLLLEADPFHPAFERHRAYLKLAGDHQQLAALMLRRAERQTGSEAAHSYLEAAAALRRSGAAEQAALCEAQAFEADPSNDAAFTAVRRQAEGDVRKLSALLHARARGLPDEATRLLRERADLLLSAGETLLAAEALDDLLRTAPDDLRALELRAELAAQAGGPSAAQPYDRKLLQLAKDRLPAPLAIKTQLRVGHASLNAGAYKDAAECFEAVVRLDPEGERGREALSLLSEVHARTHDVRGLYRTSVELARKARADEAEALYRRAAELFDDPVEALDALLPLSKLRPADPDVVDRAVEGLRRAGRFVELVDLLEKSAEASGGSLAAERLLEAARVAEEKLHDEGRAKELKKRAGRIDPDNVVALRALLDELRESGDERALAEALEKVAAGTSDEDEASLLRLELAELLSAAGQTDRSREQLERVVARGSAGAGYAAALEALEAICVRSGDEATLAKVLASRAELASGEARAELLVRAAKAATSVGALDEASKLARAALAVRPSVDALLLLARASKRLGQHEKAAAALVQAAALSPSASGGPLLVEAVDEWEAAGEPAEARDLLDRIVSEHPGVLEPAAVAERFARLGASDRAASYGFAPAMAAGQHEQALALAEAAHDAERAREALWALALEDGAGPHAFRLAAELREGRDVQGLFRLAEQCEQSGALEHAWSLFEELFLEAPSLEMRRAVLARLVKWGQLAKAIDAVLFVDLPDRRAALELLLEVASDAPKESRERLYQAAADVLPARATALWRELFELRRADGRLEEAAEALEQLVQAEDDPRARSALHAELGELYVGPLSQPSRAREAFELALTEDLENAIAVQQLIKLYRPDEEPDRFAAMVERLSRLAGDAAVAAYREPLADAYERLGRRADALELLSQLPETRERLERRVRLAAELGRVGQSLELRERLASSADELERIAWGYAEAGLWPSTVRVVERLLDSGGLSAQARRLLAERLSPNVDGAALAVRLWPELLWSNVGDADAWTLFAEALALLQRKAESQLADGFGAALTASLAASPLPRPMPVRRGEVARSSRPPNDLVPVETRTMPRLYQVLSDALAALGAPGVTPMLDPGGGAEAYLTSADQLVIGAGALGVFGPPEVTYLCALALALGDRGQHLSRPGAVEGFADAAADAFRALPSSLAASRVLFALDERVRGRAPDSASVREVLSSSEAFARVARVALEMISGG